MTEFTNDSIVPKLNEVEENLVCAPFIIDVQVDRKANGSCLPDTGCNTSALIESRYVERHALDRISIEPRSVHAYDERPPEVVSAIAKFELDVGGHKSVVYAYEVSEMRDQNIILGLPWLKKHKVVIEPEGPALLFRDTGLRVKNIYEDGDYQPISAASYSTLARIKKRGVPIQLFAASLNDIEKALKPKNHSNPRDVLPSQYHDYLDVFDRKIADTLPPFRGPGVDHKIELIPDGDGKEPQVPFGPLYHMSRDELLVLRKTLTEYLDKGFIRVSNSPAAAPVLFAKKPGGGLRFCVDYRGLNAISRKDRYPLPLINETLERVGKASWFTKLDVIQAFHKIRIEEGSEWMTAFRTRYGLFEWLVTPFGLANAPSTFQKYINWVLREFLDEFVSAYIDDILIFTSGSLRRHRQHVRLVLEKLREAGLQIDIDKCEFETKSTKYLGFIIESGRGIRMDPAKIQAILEWEAPRSVKGVRAFLGFANFYRRFIKGFTHIASPLVELTKKDTPFRWDSEAAEAFDRLKKLFVSAPILMQFDPDRETVLEVDSSGYVVGGLLSQYDDEGVIRPCAFFSKRNLPAECNYKIYDKELLAIVKCIREWSSELRSVKDFKVITDHKNLTYFTTTRRLNERQVRWAEELSQYNFWIEYRPGKDGTQPDVLSRREQDMPNGIDDRFDHRDMTLLKPERLQGFHAVRTNCTQLRVRPVAIQEEERSNPDRDEIGYTEAPEESSPLQVSWDNSRANDRLLRELAASVRDGRARFPPSLNVKVSISECSLNDRDELCFRGRRWVPYSEPLRTQLMQDLHDSAMSGHPGRENLYALLARDFFWPGMSNDVRQFVRNCETCGSAKVRRERKQGLLKPLPVPDRIWREISVDFIVQLPKSRGCTNLTVITDRLSKGIILIPMETIDTLSFAKAFVNHFYQHHGVPHAIVSDRGSAFISAMWTRVCQLLHIKRRISTAYHPETDGSTERMNAEVETYLRIYCSYGQRNWVDILPSAQLALNSRDSATTGLSPFFMTHGYNLEILDLNEPSNQSDRRRRSPIQQGEEIVQKLKTASDWAQASMASAQQLQEAYSNNSRDVAPAYCVGQPVWLDLRHVKTDRPSKKLDMKNKKFTVLEKIGSHAYRLDTPPGIHNVFHAWLLRPAASDPFPSQRRRAPHRPTTVSEDLDDDIEIERILNEGWVGSGTHRRKHYLVKWKLWPEPTWESADTLSSFLSPGRLAQLMPSPHRRSLEGGNVGVADP